MTQFRSIAKFIVAATLIPLGAAAGAGQAGADPAPQTPVPPAASGFEPLPAPQRLLDTRPGGSTADGMFAGQGLRPASGTLELQVAGRAGVSPTAASVVLNVTVDAAEHDGFVTVHPCDVPRPNASNLNYRVGQTIPNTVVAKLGASGSVCLFTLGATHLIVDVSGVLHADAYVPLAAPQRLLDTREGQTTADGLFGGIGLRQAGGVVELPVAGRAGAPPAASSVVLNVTVADAAANGFVTVYPCDGPRPNASNLNYVVGLTIPNAVVTKLSSGGTVCLFTSGATHLIVDIAGVLSPSSFVALAAPQRVLDSRGSGATADGLFSGAGIRPVGGTLQLKIAGRVGVPADASAVVLNVTAVDATVSGFVTSHPRGTPRPNASNLNFVAEQVIPNVVIAGAGPNGEVCFFTSGATHLIVDVAGWLTGPAPALTGTNCSSTLSALTDAEVAAALLVRPTLQRVTGEDRIGVSVCDVPSNSTNPFYQSLESVVVDPTEVAAWAQRTAAPYFAEVSLSRYTTTFTPLGRIQLSPTDGPTECLTKATLITGAPYTNVLVTDTRSYGGGLAGPGLISSSTALDRSVLAAQPPSTTGRGAWVGGGSAGGAYLNPFVVIHEIGHTLHWPHSYSGLSDEYDNQLDVMSGYPRGGFCSAPTAGGGTTRWLCEPQHTLAFNRFAAGWIDGNQVAIHRSGAANYTLDAPTREGLQFVALPDASDPRSMLTIEARPRIGRDRFLEVEGVALHLIDQVPRKASLGSFDGVGTRRRQRQALGAPNTYEHVVGVGSSVTVHGVTVTVLGRVGDSYEITVSGTYVTPAASLLSERVAPAFTVVVTRPGSLAPRGIGTAVDIHYLP